MIKKSLCLLFLCCMHGFVLGAPKKASQHAGHARVKSVDFDAFLAEQRQRDVITERVMVLRELGAIASNKAQILQAFLAEHALQNEFVAACAEYCDILARRGKFYCNLSSLYPSNATIACTNAGDFSIRISVGSDALSERESFVARLILKNFTFDPVLYGYKASSMTEEQANIVESLLRVQTLSAAARNALRMLYDLHVWNKLAVDLADAGERVTQLSGRIKIFITKAHPLHKGAGIIRKMLTAALRWKINSASDGERPTRLDIAFGDEMKVLVNEYAGCDCHRIAVLVRSIIEEGLECKSTNVVQVLDIRQEHVVTPEIVTIPSARSVLDSPASIDGCAWYDECMAYAMNEGCWLPRVKVWFENAQAAVAQRERIDNMQFSAAAQKRLICHHRFTRTVDAYIHELGITVPVREAGIYSINIPGEIEYRDGSVEVGVFSWGVNIKEKKCFHRSFAKRILEEIQDIVARRIYDKEFPPLYGVNEFQQRSTVFGDSAFGADEGLWIKIDDPANNIIIRLYKVRS